MKGSTTPEQPETQHDIRSSTSLDGMDADVIAGFQRADPNCAGCGKSLTVENAWMTDGCPCNSPLGVNSMNETRWRLLMSLQQRQSVELQDLKRQHDRLDERFRILQIELVSIRSTHVNDRVDEGCQLRAFRDLVDRWVPSSV